MPRPCDLLTLKVVSESRVTWATSVSILVFLDLCSRLRPDVRNRQTDKQTSDSIIAYCPRLGSGGIIKERLTYLVFCEFISVFVFVTITVHLSF